MSVPPHGGAAARVDNPTISFGGFQLDRSRRLLSKDGEPVRIGSRALDILIVLVDRAGEIVGRHELLDLVWRDVVVDEAGVRVHMSALRRALGDGRDGARYIVNVAGRGYSFVAPVTRAGPEEQPAPSASRPAGRVSPAARSIIGRDRVVASLGELLSARRFVSIVGAGGIGKTTVATAIVDRLRPDFGDGNVALVDLGAVVEPSLVPGAVIAAVGCTRGGPDPVADLLAFLAGRRMLIVFDSCEHLAEPTSELASQIFHHAPRVHLLITSRESLRVEGETVHLLSPLAYPAEEFPTAADALATPAVQLFMDRAAFSGFHGELTDADAPVVSEICRRTDGIALAIELAASRVGAYGIRGVAELLATSVELRLVGRRNVAPRHRTLAATLDWSFNLLSGDEQRLLARLSAFVGPFSIDAACSVAGDGEHDRARVAENLAGLVDKSLVWVQPIGDAVFYRLPDMMRSYARGKLDEFEEFEPIARRHADYFAAWFKAVALEHGAYADIGRHAPHLGNLRKALEWSFAHEATRSIGVELAADAAPLFLGLWLLSECRHWTSLALSSTDGIRELPRRQVSLLEALAVSTMHTRGNTKEVRDAIERGLDISEEHGGDLTQLRLLGGLNLFLTRLGDFEGALAAARRCGAIAERSGTVVDRIVSEWMLAAACHLGGNQATALEHCERGFALEADMGRLQINLFGYDHHLRAELALARSLWLMGAPVRARRLALEAMENAAGSPLPGDYSMAAAHGIPVLLWSGETEESGKHVERLIAHAERHSFTSHAAAAWALKGEWLISTGEPSAGIETLRRALSMLQREQFHMVIPAAWTALADGLVRCGSYLEARETIDTAIASAPQMGQRFWLPNLLRMQGEVSLNGPRPDPEAAEKAFRASIDLAREQGAVSWELKTALPLVRFLLEQDRPADARATLEPIYSACPEKIGTRDLEEAEQILASLG